jgi:hemolysin III
MHVHLFREPISAWTHFAWMALALPATVLLCRRAGRDVTRLAGAAVFGATLTLCYAGSWLYHSVPPEHAAFFHALDHVGIYLLIAGTVTPIGLVVLDGWWRLGLVGGIWLLAASGIAVRLLATVPLPVMTGLYLFMGWVGCATYFELASRLSHARMRLLWAGGLVYTAGAVLNSMRWPVLVPGVFEAHELFHLFVMAGSVCHYLFVLHEVLPYQAREVKAAGAGVVVSGRRVKRRTNATVDA